MFKQTQRKRFSFANGTEAEAYMRSEKFKDTTPNKGQEQKVVASQKTPHVSRVAKL